MVRVLTALLVLVLFALPTSTFARSRQIGRAHV